MQLFGNEIVSLKRIVFFVFQAQCDLTENTALKSFRVTGIMQAECFQSIIQKLALTTQNLGYDFRNTRTEGWLHALPHKALQRQ